ncbi:AAA family ATPase [Synechococcus sp. UW86]|uniref:AAA family ATPase n=1 Tax=Synechococcus sp. UW86 TaxID=368491 RepID=UPI000E0FDE16|nr:AAA family ATPase [Synechococcus sp. UW86]
MRLLNCQLQNVRLHGDLSLEFSPRITLIGGANETGKSTLVEALHRALFLKAKATGAPVEALQSRLHMGHPTVSVGFEAKGDTWSLRKRFSGSSGQVSLSAASSAQSLNGEVAEEVLAELVGVKETLGSRQASTVLPTRWAHLWVMQGAAGDNFLEAGKAHYDFDALLAQLEQSGGAVVQQSSHDQRVAQRVEAALDENFTSRGVKKNSPLWQRQEELERAEFALERALARLSDYEEAGIELAGISDELETLQSQELPALEQRRQLITEGAAASAKLDAAIELASKALEPLRLRHDTATKQLADVDQLAGQLQGSQQRLADLRQSQEGAEAKEQELERALETKREARLRLNAQKQQLDQSNQLLQLLVERARLSESRSRLQKEIEQLRSSAKQRSALEQQLAAGPVIGRTELGRLRELQQAWRDAATRQQAMAAGVRVLRADQPVRINGEAIASGDQRQLSSVFELQVGEGVALEITPGGGEALGDLDGQTNAAEAAVQTCLAELGATSLENAEQIAEQRSGLEQKLLALGFASQQDSATQEQELQRIEQRLDDLARQVSALASSQQELEREQQLPTALDGLLALQQGVATTLTHTTAAVTQAESDLDEASSALETFKANTRDGASQLQVAEAECLDRQSRLDALNEAHGSRGAQHAQVEQLAEQRQQAETDLGKLHAERAALGSGDQEQELADLQSQIDALQLKIEGVLDRRGAAKQRCDSISSEDPYGAVEQARVQHEAAELDYQSLKRVTDAHRLLQELFTEAQADLSSRYSEPLAQSIGSFLRPLISGGPVAQLSYDQAKGFGGLQLMRGGEFYDFHQLSGGMKEQLAAALRLSIAEVLKGSHDDCLPLVFDDAFTNSDPERVQIVKQMLGTAVDHGLQVILLTCDPGAYGDFADQAIDLNT